MDSIREYYKLNSIRIGPHRLYNPFYRPSMKHIKLTQKEIELIYKKEFDVYIPVKD